MDKQIIAGEQVTLSSAQGQIVRTVVEVSGETVFVCRHEEYIKAQIERREPISIGFPVKDVLKVGA